jgi:hypothetical protein
LQKDIKASTHNAFGAALQKLALTKLLQYAKYDKKYAKTEQCAEYDQTYPEHDKKDAEQIEQ